MDASVFLRAELEAEGARGSDVGFSKEDRGSLPTRVGRWIIGVVILLVVLVAIHYGINYLCNCGRITLWNWLQLLIVPAVLALGGYWLNRQQSQRQLEIAERNARDDALQAYLDQMSTMLADEKRPLHRAKPGDALSTVARARTLTVLRRLVGNRKGYVVQFLYESSLIMKDHPVVFLGGAELFGAYLFGAYLREANLRGANLRGANLSETEDLTQEQINEADGDERTKLPAHLQRPDHWPTHWPKGDEESEER